MKVGIVYDTLKKGLGGHGTHLAFRGLPGVEVAALTDSNTENPEPRMKTVRAERFYPSWRKMLDKESPDIVAVCSRLPEDHFAVIRAAAEKGCHVFCEKPLCSTLREADEICRLAEENHVRIAVAHLARHAFVFRTMKRLIHEGAIGRPLTFYGRGKEDHRGGGEDMLVLGTHILDLGVFLFGPPENVSAEVFQNGRPIVCSDRMPTSEPLGPVAGTDLFASFRFPGEVRGIFESRRGLFRNQVRMGVTVAGTEGCLSVRYDSERNLRRSRSPYPPEDEAAYEIVPLREDREIPGAEPPDGSLWPGDAASYFMNNNRFAAWDLMQAIQENREPAANAKDARTGMEMMTGIYQSHLDGKRIDFPLKDRENPLSRSAREPDSVRNNA